MVDELQYGWEYHFMVETLYIDGRGYKTIHSERFFRRKSAHKKAEELAREKKVKIYYTYNYVNIYETD